MDNKFNKKVYKKAYMTNFRLFITSKTNISFKQTKTLNFKNKIS